MCRGLMKQAELFELLCIEETRIVGEYFMVRGSSTQLNYLNYTGIKRKRIIG